MTALVVLLCMLLVLALAGWFFCVRNLDAARDVLDSCQEALTIAERELSFPVSRAGVSHAHSVVSAALRELRELEP